MSRRILSGGVYYAQSILRILTGFEQPSGVVSLFLERAPARKVVKLRSGPRLRVRGKMDVWALKETFLDRFYERYGSPIRDGWRVVDIGAGIGDFTIFAARSGGNVIVHGYEPFPESFGLLSENLSLNHLNNALIFNEPVAGRPERVMFDNPGGDAGQTITRRTAGAGEGSLCVPFSDVLQRIGSCDLLKMDCEGAEYSILLDTPDAAFQKVARIVMEYHDSDGRSHAELVNRLENLGYKVLVKANAAHTDIGYMYAER